MHHRVKNNLQVIVSLLRLQAQVIHDGRLADALRESQDRVESMALIHEQLYETTDLREVDLARHASLLLAKLMNSSIWRSKKTLPSWQTTLSFILAPWKK